MYSYKYFGLILVFSLDHVTIFSTGSEVWKSKEKIIWSLEQMLLQYEAEILRFEKNEFLIQNG